MNDDARPFQPRPAEYKTEMDGLGGLVRIPLEGGRHHGRELFMDETEVPAAILTTPRQAPFEWWTDAIAESMGATELGSDPMDPPGRYVLEIAPDTREPRYVAVEGDR